MIGLTFQKNRASKTFKLFQITYNIQSGIQGDDCPHPGEPYLSIGFPRTAFLPDTEVGRKVLRLLETAFQQVHRLN